MKRCPTNKQMFHRFYKTGSMLTLFQVCLHLETNRSLKPSARRCLCLQLIILVTVCLSRRSNIYEYQSLQPLRNHFSQSSSSNESRRPVCRRESRSSEPFGLPLTKQTSLSLHITSNHTLCLSSLCSRKILIGAIFRWYSHVNAAWLVEKLKD